MFKVSWERTGSVRRLANHTIEKMIGLAFSERKLISHELISGRLANINIRISLEKEKSPLVLRVCLRNNSFIYREQRLGQMLKDVIPLPFIKFIGKFDDYDFAIADLISGVSLRNVLLTDIDCNIDKIMYEVGSTLAKIISHKIPDVQNEQNRIDFLNFCEDCLSHKNILLALSEEKISKIAYFIDKYKNLLQDESEMSLVHGDFCPANILVDKIDGIWKITGVLDWEFSFFGSKLWDISNMLRYSHKMPSIFRSSFINGLIENGIILPENWEISVNLFNLLSLLDCLKRSDLKLQANRFRDICELIDHVLLNLKF